MTSTPRFVKPKFPETAQSHISITKITKDNGKTRGFDYTMGKHGQDKKGNLINTYPGYFN